MDREERTLQANRQGAEEGRAVYASVCREFEEGPSVNRALLMRILEDNRDTEYGRRYGFAGIRSVQEYRERVPVITYDDIAGYIRRMDEGEKNVLTAYPFSHMNETSGTSGPMKHVPMTDRQAQAFLRYNRNYIDGLKAELLDPAWMAGRAFCTAEGRHTTLPSGITLGDASSVMADYIRGGRETLGAMMEALFTSPVEATLPVLHTDTKYLHARFALMDGDVTGIICGFYSVAMSYLKYIADNYELLIGDIERGIIDPDVKLSREVRESLEGRLRPMPERAAELREIFRNGSAFPFVPRVWPKMLYLTGAGGDGFSNYDRIIREKYTGDCLKNIYYGVNASEGIWSVPSGLDTEDSVMAPSSAFFEFLPVEAGDDLSKCVSMDEVEPGRTYELIVTNLCGFYRYRTSDAVLVTGFRGKTPLIRFMYRVNRTVNIASEKTTEKAIQNAVEKAMLELGLELSDHSFYADLENMAYVFLVEPMRADTGIGEERLAEVIREKMRHENPDYSHLVDIGMIHPPVAHWLQPETAMLYRDMMIYRGVPSNQLKPVRIIANDAQKKFFFGLIMDPGGA